MPIEIRRFGVGHRRPDGPAGTTGVSGQIIHVDARGTVSELALARGARIEPYASPNPTWLVVFEGGGWVGVGDERTRVAAGEAVFWPPDVPHAAWTEHSEMRAFVVGFNGADDAGASALIGSATDVTSVSPAGLAPLARPARAESDPGEPA